MSSISIRRIIKKTELIQRRMALINIARFTNPQDDIKRLEAEIYRQVIETSESIDKLIFGHKISAADLAIRSRRAYQWLKFLSDQTILKVHLQALMRINQLLRILDSNCFKDPTHLNLAFYHISPLYRFQQKGNLLNVTIQECFIFAPDKILLEILTNTLCSSGTENHGKIQEYTSGSSYREKREYLEYIAVPPASYSSGKAHDLRRSFERVNHQYFNGKLSQPHLTWSKRLTRRKYGHYQSDINTISISRSLDHQNIPQFVVDYVMYHELLHKHFGSRQVNGRRYTHTPEFKNAEEKFLRIKEAQKFLTTFSWRRS